MVELYVAKYPAGCQSGNAGSFSHIFFEGLNVCIDTNKRYLYNDCYIHFFTIILS